MFGLYSGKGKKESRRGRGQNESRVACCLAVQCVKPKAAGHSIGYLAESFFGLPKPVHKSHPEPEKEPE